MKKIQKIMIILLTLVAVGLICYTVYYLVTNKNSGDKVKTDLEPATSHASSIDQLPIKDLDIKITTDTLPVTKGIVTELNFKDFKSLFSTSKKSILVVTKTGCSYCEAFRPQFKEALSNLGLNAYEVNISNLKSNENIGEYIAVYGTPITYIIENGNVTHTYSGYADTKVIEAFLDLYYLR